MGITLLRREGEKSPSRRFLLQRPCCGFWRGGLAKARGEGWPGHSSWVRWQVVRRRCGGGIVFWGIVCLFKLCYINKKVYFDMMRFLLTLPKRTTITRDNLLLVDLWGQKPLRYLQWDLSFRGRIKEFGIKYYKRRTITVADELSSNNKWNGSYSL